MLSGRLAAAVFAAVLFLLPSSSLHAQGKDPVSSFADRVAGSRVQFDYRYEMEDAGMTMTGEGNVTVQGESYRISGDGLEIWCDGKAVCTVDDAAGEVVIEPVWAGSGAFVNPAALVRNIGGGFLWDPDGRESVFSGREALEYDLTPVEPASDISGLKLCFTPDGTMLVGAELRTAKATVVFHLSSIRFGQPGDGAEFSIPSFGPEYFVTDLR